MIINRRPNAAGRVFHLDTRPGVTYVIATDGFVWREGGFRLDSKDEAALLQEPGMEFVAGEPEAPFQSDQPAVRAGVRVTMLALMTDGEAGPELEAFVSALRGMTGGELVVAEQMPRGGQTYTMLATEDVRDEYVKSGSAAEIRRQAEAGAETVDDDDEPLPSSVPTPPQLDAPSADALMDQIKGMGWNPLRRLLKLAGGESDKSDGRDGVEAALASIVNAGPEQRERVAAFIATLEGEPLTSDE